MNGLPFDKLRSSGGNNGERKMNRPESTPGVPVGLTRESRMTGEMSVDLSTTGRCGRQAAALDGPWRRVEGPVYNKGGRRPRLILSVPTALWTQSGLPGPGPRYEIDGGRMIRGVFLAMGIMIILALIPIVDIVGIPFGPFIGGYYGILSARAHGGSYAVKSVVFGSLLGLLVFLVLLVAAVALTLTLDLSQRFTWLLWMAVVVFTLYAASMAALGAMYRQLRAEAV